MLVHKIDRQNKNRLNRIVRLKESFCDAAHFTTIADLSRVVKQTLLKVPRDRSVSEIVKELEKIIFMIVLQISLLVTILIGQYRNKDFKMYFTKQNWFVLKVLVFFGFSFSGNTTQFCDLDTEITYKFEGPTLKSLPYTTHAYMAGDDFMPHPIILKQTEEMIRREKDFRARCNVAQGTNVAQLCVYRLYDDGTCDCIEAFDTPGCKGQFYLSGNEPIVFTQSDKRASSHAVDVQRISHGEGFIEVRQRLQPVMATITSTLVFLSSIEAYVENFTHATPPIDMRGQKKKRGSAKELKDLAEQKKVQIKELLEKRDAFKGDIERVVRHSEEKSTVFSSFGAFKVSGDEHREILEKYRKIVESDEKASKNDQVTKIPPENLLGFYKEILGHYGKFLGAYKHIIEECKIIIESQESLDPNKEVLALYSFFKEIQATYRKILNAYEEVLASSYERKVLNSHKESLASILSSLEQLEYHIGLRIEIVKSLNDLTKDIYREIIACLAGADFNFNGLGGAKENKNLGVFISIIRGNLSSKLPRVSQESAPSGPSTQKSLPSNSLGDLLNSQFFNLGCSEPLLLYDLFDGSLRRGDFIERITTESQTQKKKGAKPQAKKKQKSSSQAEQKQETLPQESKKIEKILIQLHSTKTPCKSCLIGCCGHLRLGGLIGVFFQELLEDLREKGMKKVSPQFMISYHDSYEGDYPFYVPIKGTFPEAPELLLLNMKRRTEEFKLLKARITEEERLRVRELLLSVLQTKDGAKLSAEDIKTILS